MVPIDFRDLSHFIPLEFYISLSSPPGPRDPSLSAERRGVAEDPGEGLATGRLWYLMIFYDILWSFSRDICHGFMQY